MATILVVDDRPSNRLFLLTLLGYGGHRLLEAGNGAQALELARSERPDLVITDILMPTMDGYEFVQHLRSDPALAPTPVIFYTATYSAPEAHTLAQSCGVEIVLPKPCEPQVILAAVDKALRVAVSASPASIAAASKAALRAHGNRQIDDSGKSYVKDLQAVKLGFDEVIEHSEKLIAQRDLARGLSKKLSANVESMQRVMTRMSALVEVGMEMEAERDPAKLVQLFFAASCDIVNSKYAAIAILDAQEKAFCHVYAKGIKPDIYKVGDHGRAGLLGSLLSGHRAMRARSLDPGSDADGLPKGHPPVQSILAVPVASADRSYGWLYFADRTGAKEFSMEDERLAGIMATRLALLYENLMLYDDIQRHAAKLQLEVAERKRTQEALRESEAGLHRAQAMAKLGHVITGSDGEFQSWSDTLPQVAGLDAPAMPRSTREWLGLIHSEDRGKFRDTAIEAGRAGARRDIEYRLKRGGGWIHVRQTMEPFDDKEGAAAGRWFNTLQDITEQKRAAEALQASEARFRAIFEQAATGIAHSDLSGRFVDVNPKICEISGYSRDEVLRLGIPDLTHPDDIARSNEARAGLLAGRSSFYEREARLIRKDRSNIWTHITTSLVRTAGGEPAHYISVVHDISERRRAEQEVQRFGKAMDASPDSIYLTDPATMRFVYLNDTARLRLGYTREQLMQMGPQDVLPDGGGGISREFDEVIAAGDQGLIHERPFEREDGTRGWTELHRRALRSEGGTLIVTIGRDITERKLAEDRIRRLNRIHAVLSGINALIVRVHDRDELFKEACRIAVDHGGFKMAWIGIVDRVAMKISPVASAGAEAEFMTLIKDRFSLVEDSQMGNTMTARAVREKQAIVSNEMRSDSKILFAKERAERGISSMAILPLLVSDEAVGVLALYAGEAGFFDEEEMKLLLELAGDIAFALDHIEKKEKIDYLAYYDQLTGLANRALFHERLAQHLHAAESSESKLAVVVADIDRFRMINDSLGRQAGDTLLKQISERLAAAVGQNEIARISADLFAIVLPEVKGRSEIGRTVEDIWRNCLDQPFMLNDTEIRVSMKGGIALFPSDGGSADTLFRNAEAAWKKAKQTGERYLFHAPEMTARIAENLQLENKLRQALDKEEFVLHYQPKVDLDTRQIVGVEALIRWNSAERGLVPPGQFIPLLEETGLILEVGAWALRRAVLDHRHWVREAVAAPRIAVNVSAIQLRQRDFVDVVKEAIAGGANPTAIDVEITESLLMEDVAGNIKKLKALRDLGMKISIDDFGTGYSSLGYLAKLPVHTLKIDRSFIIAMLNEPDTMTLVQTIISLAHSLRLTVVAEGVEQEEQARMLRLLRCDQMQGYLVSKPAPMEDLTPLLREKS